MKIKIDCQLLDEQIKLCDICSDNAKEEYEKELFDGIANLLSNICCALKNDEIVDISKCIK